jgi:hypothetical protein
MSSSQLEQLQILNSQVSKIIPTLELEKGIKFVGFEFTYEQLFLHFEYNLTKFVLVFDPNKNLLTNTNSNEYRELIVDLQEPNQLSDFIFKSIHRQYISHYGYRVHGFIITNSDVIMVYNLRVQNSDNYYPINQKFFLRSSTHKDQIKALSKLFNSTRIHCDGSGVFEFEEFGLCHALYYRYINNELKGEKNSKVEDDYEKFYPTNFNVEVFPEHVVSNVIISMSRIINQIVSNNQKLVLTLS